MEHSGCNGILADLSLCVGPKCISARNLIHIQTDFAMWSLAQPEAERWAKAVHQCG
jgi:hypothetical protein